MEPTHFESIYPIESRFKEIEALISYIKQGKSAQIVGIPGIGKSNLLKLLTFNRNLRIKHLGENQKWYHFVNIDLSLVEDKPLSDVIKLIILNIRDSLEQRGLNDEYKRIDDLLLKNSSSEDGLMLFEMLKKTVSIVSIEKELTLVLLIDKFEAYLPSLNKKFFTDLKILRDEAKYRFSVILSLNHPLENNVEENLLSDFYEYIAGNIIYLPIQDKPGLDFRIAYLEKSSGKNIDQKLKDQIISLTNGHGKLTRLCLESLLLTSDTLDIKEHLLSNNLIKNALKSIWNTLSFAEQTTLMEFAKKSPGLKDPDAKTHLEKIDLVHDNNTISIPLLKEFLNQSSFTQGGDQKIIITEDNEIQKGNIILSDKLTNLEIRLLKFLIENKGKVLDREEIIQNVWTDLKSTQGVTDQALDQIIFRLRRKIEENPNKPIHIQTVKGRGIKFSPQELNP